MNEHWKYFERGLRYFVVKNCYYVMHYTSNRHVIHERYRYDVSVNK